MIMQINNKYIKTRAWKLYSRFLSYALFEGRPLTTRGRWINSIVFGLYSVYKLLPLMKKVRQPVYILGTGRSGTTILGIVMSIHKEIGFLNEPKALWHAINKHEDLNGNYTDQNAYYFLDESHSNEQQKSDIHKLYGAYLRLTFNSRVVDKYPELIFRVPYVKHFFPDAKFIFLVRNGWDTCASIEKWSQRLGKTDVAETEDWWGVNNRKWSLLVEQVIKPDVYFKDVIPVISEINKHSDMAALEWIATMKQGLLMLEKYPDSILRVDYEELVENPTEILYKIEQFGGLENDNVFIQYGNDVLKPVKAKKAFSLHPQILPLFTETMEKLGYKV